MSDTTLEEIIEDVKSLPPEQQEKLREAVNLIVTLFLVGQMMEIMEKTLTLMPHDMQRLRDILNSVTLDFAGAEDRAQMARSVRGKYAHLPTSSDAFAARKSEEIRLEDSRVRP
jgi:DNA-directed RNA polymerase subunit F